MGLEGHCNRSIASRRIFLYIARVTQPLGSSRCTYFITAINAQPEHVIVSIILPPYYDSLRAQSDTNPHFWYVVLHFWNEELFPLTLPVPQLFKLGGIARERQLPVEVRPKSMHVFDRWRPQRLVGHGDRLVLAALDLLRAHRVQLSQLERLHAQELLDQ